MAVNEHCCKDMAESLADEKCPVFYWPVRRLYGFQGNEQSYIYPLYYCPWCAKKLPDDLHKKLCRLVFDDLEELEIGDFADPRLPEEFKTDEWWKKRGL